MYNSLALFYCFIDTYMMALIGHSSVTVWTEYPLIAGNGILIVMYLRQHSWYTVKQGKEIIRLDKTGKKSKLKELHLSVTVEFA